MGMFDDVKISIEKLPISDEEKKMLGENPGWQTKDFDSSLDIIEITDDGELKIWANQY